MSPGRPLTTAISACLLLGILWINHGDSSPAFGQSVGTVPKPEKQAPGHANPTDQLANLIQMQADIDRILPRITPAVVAVEGGSGTIVSSSGVVLTASHVTRKSGRIVNVQLSDGRKVHGKTLGTNKHSDTGAIQLLGDGPWPHLTLAESDEVEQGDWCLALGYPLSFQRGTEAAVRIGRIQDTENQFISDCPIMGGDSGGPLVNLNGNLIGISSRIKTRITQNFHIPTNVFLKDWKRLAASVDTQKDPGKPGAYLGIQGQTDRGRVRILKVHQGSPAEKSGLKIDDVILQLDGQPIENFEDVLKILGDRRPGQKLMTNLNRHGRLIDIAIELGQRKKLTSSTSQADPFPVPSRNLTSPTASLTFGRTTPAVKQSLAPLMRRHAPSVVRIENEYQQTGLGTVVSTKGMILAKYSDLSPTFTCVLANGQRHPGKIIGAHPQNDLALIQIPANDLAPILFSFDRPSAGTLVVAIGPEIAGKALSFGTVAVAPQGFEIARVSGSDSIRLGITVSANPVIHPPSSDSTPLLHQVFYGLGVSRVNPRTPAEDSGLLVGDLIQSVNGTAIETQHQLKQIVRSLISGQPLTIQVVRDGKILGLKTQVKKSQPKTAYDLWGGGPFSHRRFGFATVIAHDGVLKPQDCGGPLVDLQGRVVGINIARAMRTATFAIPIEDVYRFVRQIRPDADLKISRK